MTKIEELRAYWDKLDRHDWTYAFSDDGGVYRAGRAAEYALVKEAEKGVAFEAMFELMRRHYCADREVRHLHPKPERP